MASPPERVPAQSRGTGLATAGSLTAGGMMTMNLLAYAFTLLASHALGPEHFGAVSAFLGILLVANVGALALQATAARRIATTRATIGRRLETRSPATSWSVPFAWQPAWAQ